jgi:transcriptional regulator with XRE-family HTH domain
LRSGAELVPPEPPVFPPLLPPEPPPDPPFPPERNSIYLSQSYYAQIEGETRPINDRIIALICARYGVSKGFLLTGTGEIFSESLPDMQLHQLLDIYHELDPLFKEYILLQIKQLLEVQKRSKEQDGK